MFDKRSIVSGRGLKTRLVRGRIRWTYLASVAVPLIWMLAFALLRPPGFNQLANLVFDSYQRLSPRVWHPSSPVRIVDIDEASLDRIGQWPWPRTRIAELVEKAAAGEAAAVAFDVVFAEPDRLSPEQTLRDLPSEESRRQVAAALSGFESHDIRLANAMRKVPVVLGTILTQSARGQSGGAANPLLVKTGITHIGDDPVPWVYDYSGAAAPLPVLAKAAAGVGALNWLPTRDQVIREVPLLLRSGDTLVPSLGIEALRTAQKASTISIRRPP